ncbi:hypothetical protein F443_06143 [Phytophthora nicotianae P1569]|uniref:Uncharacterized protein n=1 Tax=Phytophthora nicotianae P1569 TaxID=1317065 RepID=V9FFM7_PHYNI|nr:hypothetical protein F443_06143 [Phytophthora nicotianae P1569]
MEVLRNDLRVHIYKARGEDLRVHIYKARGEGKRSRQESRALDCKAQFNLCVRCNGQNGEFTLCVTGYVPQCTQVI